MMTNKENKIDFENPNGSIVANEEFSGPIVASEWTTIEGVKGVRYKTWKYENVSDEIVDGALVEVMPGCRTPVQYVETDHVFDENIQQGKFLLFHITSEGLSVYKYDSSIEEISFSLQVHKGELMCLYALKENDQPGEIIECEQPGFSLAKLVTVPDGTERIGELEIPSEFWNAIKMLDDGNERDLTIDILDMAEEMSESEPEDKIYDKYQNQDFVDLVETDGVSEEQLAQVLKLREIKNRDIFVENQNSFSETSNFFVGLSREIESSRKNLLGLRDALSDPPTTLQLKDIEKVKEKILFLETMGMFDKSTLHICLRINAIFKRRKQDIMAKVRPTFGTQFSADHLDLVPPKVGREEAMGILTKYPEVVDIYMPIMSEVGSYNSSLTLIKNKPDLALKMASLFVDKDSGLDQETRRTLLEIYSEHSGLPELGDTVSDMPLELDHISTRLSRSSEPDVVKNYLRENSEQVQKILSLIPEGEKVFEVGKGIEGHALVILDARDDRYLLVKILPTPNLKGTSEYIAFEPYYLYLYKSGIIQSDQDPRYFDRGYLHRDTPQIREEDLISAIFQKLSSEVPDDYDMCDACGFTEYALSH